MIYFILLSSYAFHTEYLLYKFSYRSRATVQLAEADNNCEYYSHIYSKVFCLGYSLTLSFNQPLSTTKNITIAVAMPGADEGHT